MRTDPGAELKLACETPATGAEIPGNFPEGEVGLGFHERKELMTIIVEIGKGDEENIVIYDGDRAEDVAKDFATRHGLNQALEKKLCANIGQNIERTLAEDGPVPEKSSPAPKAETPSPELPLLELPENLPEDVQERKSMTDAAKIVENKVPHDEVVPAEKEQANTEEKDEDSPSEEAVVPKITERKSPRPNFGSKLYEKGVKKLEQHERQCRTALEEREKAELRRYTFRPKINAASRLMARSTSGARLEDRLIHEGLLTRERKEKQRSTVLVEDTLKCTFSPQVDRK